MQIRTKQLAWHYRKSVCPWIDYQAINGRRDTNGTGNVSNLRLHLRISPFLHNATWLFSTGTQAVPFAGAASIFGLLFDIYLL